MLDPNAGSRYSRRELDLSMGPVPNDSLIYLSMGSSYRWPVLRRIVYNQTNTEYGKS